MRTPTTIESRKSWPHYGAGAPRAATRAQIRIRRAPAGLASLPQRTRPGLEPRCRGRRGCDVGCAVTADVLARLNLEATVRPTRQAAPRHATGGGLVAITAPGCRVTRHARPASWRRDVAVGAVRCTACGVVGPQLASALWACGCSRAPQPRRGVRRARRAAQRQRPEIWWRSPRPSRAPPIDSRGGRCSCDVAVGAGARYGLHENR